MSGGTNEDGEPWIYKPLDWSSDPSGAAVVAVGAVVGIVIVHFVLHAVYLGDKALAGCLCGVRDDMNDVDDDLDGEIVMEDGEKRKWARKTSTASVA